MKKMKYQVTLEAPLGIKDGMMTIEIDGIHISGILDIMKVQNLFSGITDNGICRISGTLKTHTHTVPYEANGTISDYTVSFMLVTERSNMRLTGSVYNE